MVNWKWSFGGIVDLAIVVPFGIFKYTTNVLDCNRSLNIFFTYAVGDLLWQI
jgi:hypothetical protein